MAEMGVMAVSISLLEKEHIAQYAHDNNISVSSLVCKVMAEYTGYDLTGEKNGRVERRGRPKKYNTEEERKEAARTRTRERDDLTRRLLEDHKAQQRRQDAAKLQAYLDRREGVK